MLAISIDFIQNWVRGFSGPWLYIITFVLAFAETGTLLFFVPGEFTLIFAGVTAGLSKGSVNVWIMVIVGCSAAILGDFVGFHIGKKYGDRLKGSKLGSKLGAENWAKAEDLIRRRKGLIVLIGRWLGFLRAIMPATAGMTGMDYKRDFVLFDVLGAVSWATVCVLGGWKLGERAEDVVKYIGWVVGGAVLLGIAYFLIKRKRAVKLPTA
jgi:membrane-associated protein